MIAAHIHNPVPREMWYTSEVLIIKSGRVRIDFYSDDRQQLESSLLETGDLMLLAFGVHGFARRGFYQPAGLALTNDQTEQFAQGLKDILA